MSIISHNFKLSPIISTKVYEAQTKNTIHIYPDYAVTNNDHWESENVKIQ